MSCGCQPRCFRFVSAVLRTIQLRGAALAASLWSDGFGLGWWDLFPYEYKFLARTIIGDLKTADILGETVFLRQLRSRKPMLRGMTRRQAHHVSYG